MSKLLSDRELRRRVIEYISGVQVGSVSHSAATDGLVQLIQSQKQAEYRRGFSDGQDSLLYDGQIELIPIEEAKVYAVKHADMVVGADEETEGNQIGKRRIRDELRAEQRERNKL